MKKFNCPNLCGDNFQTYLSDGVNGDVYFCKKCLFVWSIQTWQREREEIIRKIDELREKEKIKKAKQKKRR